MRGGGCVWGPDVTDWFLETYDFKMIVRSHECHQDGFKWAHDHKVGENQITLPFSISFFPSSLLSFLCHFPPFSLPFLLSFLCHFPPFSLPFLFHLSSIFSVFIFPLLFSSGTPSSVLMVQPLRAHHFGTATHAPSFETRDLPMVSLGPHSVLGIQLLRAWEQRGWVCRVQAQRAGPSSDQNV
jgi:hypothetical protein